MIKQVSLLVAATNNNVIGNQNTLPWKLKSDLKRFKELTTNNIVIMGRNTFESIGKPLPNRVNIVITSQTDYKPDGVIIVNSLEDAIQETYKQEYLNCKPFIIGGGKVYKQALENDYVNELHLTRINTNIEGDTFFSWFSDSSWSLSSAETVKKSEIDEYDSCYELWIKNKV